MKYYDIDVITFKNVSCYGLLDVNSVLSPMHTGEYVQVFYFPGLQYVAYRPKEPSQVLNYLL